MSSFPWLRLLTLSATVTFTRLSTFVVLASKQEGAPHLTGYSLVATYTVSETISPNFPLVRGGTVEKYVVSPVLPMGLLFSTETGVISGTPMRVADENTYVVTATNSAGSASLNIVVVVLAEEHWSTESDPNDGLQTVLYFVLNWPHLIGRSFLDGSGIKELVSTADGLDYPHGLAIDIEDNFMYWSDSGRMSDKIQRSRLDGTDVVDLIFGPLAWGLAVERQQGKLYWSDMAANKIQRGDLDGNSVEDLVIDIDSPTGLALDVRSNHMYWCSLGGKEGKVQRANLDGSDVVDLVKNLSYPQGIALDFVHRHMFWTDSGTFKIQRANFNGSGITDLIADRIVDPYSVAVDASAGKLYWSSVGTKYFEKKAPSLDTTNGMIQRSNLDGSDVEDLVETGRRKAFAIALGFARPPTQKASCSLTDENCEAEVAWL